MDFEAWYIFMLSLKFLKNILFTVSKQNGIAWPSLITQELELLCQYQTNYITRNKEDHLIMSWS